MKRRHLIAYIDEDRDAIGRFQSRVYETLDVIPFLPKPELDEFVDELFNSGAEAFVVDYRLNEYRDDEREPVNYDGIELIEKIWRIRNRFPCFVLTSYDGAAVEEMYDVNFVYPKDVLTSDKQAGQVSFAEKVGTQIEHYQAALEKKNERFFQLLEKSEKAQLTEDEENELLDLDSFLESSLNAQNAIQPEKKNQLAIGRIDELLKSTNELLKILKRKED